MTALRTALLVALAACELKQIDHAGGSSASTTASPDSTTSTGTSSTSTTTTPDATTTSAPTSSTGVDFIAPPDLPDEPPPVPCDPHADMPCPRGQKCSAAAPDELSWLIWVARPACFPIHGDKQKGEPCDVGPGLYDGLDDCGPGTICIDITEFGGTDGTCVAFCDPATQDAGPPMSCADPTEFCYSPGCQECLLTVCVPACDPLNPNCPAGTECVQSFSNADYAFACEVVDPDLPQALEPCEFYECAPGTHCVLSSEVVSPQCLAAETCCTPLCDLEAANTCPGAAMGEICRPFYPAPYDLAEDPWAAPYNKLGYCALP